MKYYGYYCDATQGLGEMDSKKTQLPSIKDQPRSEDRDLIRLVTGYLQDGFPLAQALGWDHDVFDPHIETPLGTRTDGVWVWPEDAIYYCREYGILPNGEFLSRIKDLHGVCPQPAHDQISAILDVVFGPPRGNMRGASSK